MALPKRPYLSEEVFTWPEFQAFAERLGIDANSEGTRRLMIDFRGVGQPVEIIHEYISLTTDPQTGLSIQQREIEEM